MIKKLKYRFIFIVMVSVFIVLFSIMLTLYIRQYNNLINDAEKKIEMIQLNNGEFPSSPKPDIGGGDFNFSPETPFETRFFTVTLLTNGTYVSSNTASIASVDTDDAVTYANYIYKNNKAKGFIDDYRFYAYQDGQYVRIIFLDCGRQLDTVRANTKSSLFVGLASLVIILLLVVFFSRLVFYPVAETYKKQKQFITDASHELKTPLTVISASCECLEMESEENEWTKSIKAQVQRLTELTNKLVFLSRMDEESLNMVMTDFSLSEIVQEKANEYIPLSVANNKTYNVNIQDNISYKGDASMIKQMLSLLLDNSFKYSKDNISISLTQTNKTKKLVIYNDCENIDNNDLSLLFERFYRTDSSRNSKTGGHGIGLSVVKAICDLHKAKIDAVSADNKSLTITIIF